MNSKRFHLVSQQGIEIIDGRTVATTSPAWLRIEPFAELVRRKWVRLRYSSSFFDDPVRPLICFMIKGRDSIILPMNGPVLGSAEWVGRIPDDTTAIFISPVQQPGRFDFQLDDVISIRRTVLAARGLWQNPDWLLWAARSRLVKSRREAWQAIGFATGGTAMSDYARWHRRFARPLQRDGLDAPRHDWRTGPGFRLILRLKKDCDPVRLGETMQSLRNQIYPHWSVCAFSDATTNASLLAAFRWLVGNDARFSQASLDQDQIIDKRNADDLVASIDVGDRLPNYALAVVAEVILRQPELEFIYADEDFITATGHLGHPILKPAWSPVFQQCTGYIGRPAFFRLQRLDCEELRSIVSREEVVINQLLQQIPKSHIHHIRRVLYSRQSSTDVGATLTSRLEPIAVEPKAWPKVSVVIPTRNNAQLLAECLGGLRVKTDYPFIETCVVDNGSSDPAAVRLLQEIATVPNMIVLHRPGPFNFSALSNDGARATSGSVLLFLNNDIAMFQRQWLKALVRWAIEPQIGVVGAKLLFPNRRVQHAGVVLGFGGIAGHLYRQMSADYRGYMAQLVLPHEVSAVTGACMAVTRTKFEAVGGFDSEHLRVDLNDIDLCLRIAASGWTNIWTPEATLIHHQSATRGIDSDPFALYRDERTYFVQRWSDVIRDDPFFHPALSLYAHDAALG
jgi:GT2 family glycosyltransferase